MRIVKHVVVMAVGSGGDIAPLAAIATKVAERGIDTTLLAPQRYEHFVARTKVSFLSIGAEEVFAEVFDNPDVWDPAKGFSVSWRYYGAAMRSAFFMLCKNWSATDTILVSSSFAVAARLAEEINGYHNTTVHLSPSIIFSAIKPPRWPKASIPERWPLWLKQLMLAAAERLATDRVIGAHVNPLRAELGLAPVRKLFSQWIHSPKRVVYAFPEWYAPPSEDWPPHGIFTSFPNSILSERVLSPGLDAFLQSRSGPVIIITVGTAVASRPSWVDRIIHLAINQGARVVVVEPTSAALKYEAGAYRIPFAPFDVLLPRAQLIVHHAGIGTMAEALRAGIPQLLVPGAHDQPDNANRLQNLGLGRVLIPNFTNDDFLDAWQWALSNVQFRQMMRKIQDRISLEGDGATRIAEIVTTKFG